MMTCRFCWMVQRISLQSSLKDPRRWCALRSLIYSSGGNVKIQSLILISTMIYLINIFSSFREDPSADPSEILPQNPSAESFRKCLFRIENPSAESFRKDPSATIGQQKNKLILWILPQPSAKSFRGTLPQMLILHWKSFRGILPQNPSAKISYLLNSLWHKTL